MSTHKKHLTRRRLLAASAVGVAGSGAAVAAGTGLLSSASAATFGYTANGSTYVIDTGASLVFKVSKATGDLTSLVYRGKEYEGYGGRHSHVGPRLLDRRHQAVRDDDDPGHCRARHAQALLRGAQRPEQRLPLTSSRS